MQFDDLVEVFTDKLVAKIPSSADGVVKEIKYEVDDVCLVGHSLLSLVTDQGEELVIEVKTPEKVASPVAAAPAQAASN